MQKIIYAIITIVSAAFVTNSDYLTIPKEFSGLSKDDIVNISLENLLALLIVIILTTIIFSSFKKNKKLRKKISFHLPFKSMVTISILDSFGQELDTLQNDMMNSGQYEFVLDLNGFQNGVYYYKIKAEKDDKLLEQTMKLIVVK